MLTQRPHDGLSKGAIERKIYFGNARGRRKTALIRHVVAAERADIVQRPCFASHHPVSEREIGVGGFRGLVLKHRLIEAGRQRIDQIDIARELSVLLFRDASGNEYAEMPDGFMDRVDDRLPVGPDVIDALIEVEDPIERLLGRRDVVAFRAEHDDRRPDIAKIDCGAIRGLDASGGKVVANKQLIDDELDFLGIQIDVAAPPLFETQIPGRLGVDLRIEIVLLAPQRVGRVLIFEILHQPGAVELAVAEIAGQRGQPAAAEQSARIAHGILPRTPAQYERGDPATMIGPNNSGRIAASIMIAQPAWQFPITQGLPFASGYCAATFSMKIGLGAGNVLDGLSWNGIGQKSDEVARMTGLECDADFAVGLESADAGTVSGARVNDNERPQLRIDFDASGRNDARKHIVHRALERASIDNKLRFVVEHVRRCFRHVLAILVPALAHDIPEQDAALECVDRVFHGRRENAERRHVRLCRRKVCLC